MVRAGRAAQEFHHADGQSQLDAALSVAMDQEDEESGSLDGEVLVGVCQVSCNFCMICYKRLTFIELVPLGHGVWLPSIL